MTMKVLLSWQLMLITNYVLAGGVSVDNGGDTVVCRDDPGAIVKGEFSLDYILTVNLKHPEKDIALAASWEKSAERILALLKMKLPVAARSFEDFVKRIQSRSPVFNRVWQPKAFGLVDLPDEKVVGRLPANCYHKKSNSILIHQAVLRRRMIANPKKIYYVYDQKRTDRLRDNAPMQFSFLMVHEWLWDITTDGWVNRTLNHLIHSLEFETLSGAELKNILLNFGIKEERFVDANNPLTGLLEAAVLCKDKPSKFVLNKSTRTIGAGQTRTFSFEHTDKSKGCFFGVEIEYQFADPGAELILTVTSHNSGGIFPKKTISLGLPNQEHFGRTFKYGLCRKSPCYIGRNRIGDFGHFANHSMKGKWTIRVKNTASTSARLGELRVVTSGLK